MTSRRGCDPPWGCGLARWGPAEGQWLSSLPKAASDFQLAPGLSQTRWVSISLGPLREGAERPSFSGDAAPPGRWEGWWSGVRTIRLVPAAPFQPQLIMGPGASISDSSFPKEEREYQDRSHRRSFCGSAVRLTNLTSIHEDEGSIPGLALWVKDPALL